MGPSPDPVIRNAGGSRRAVADLAPPATVRRFPVVFGTYGNIGTCGGISGRHAALPSRDGPVAGDPSSEAARP